MTLVVAWISGAVVIVAAIGSAVSAHSFRVRQWRYERQHDAYAAFLDATWRRVAAQGSIHIMMVDNPASEWKNYVALIDEAERTFSDTVHRVELVGSQEAVTQVRRLAQVHHKLARNLLEHIASQSHESGWFKHVFATFSDHIDAIEKFTDAARRDIRAKGTLDHGPPPPAVPTVVVACDGWERRLSDWLTRIDRD